MTGQEYCPWCQWDSPGAKTHPECQIKWDQRVKLEKLIKPALEELGINPHRDNLLVDLCRRIENQLAMRKDG